MSRIRTALFGLLAVLLCLGIFSGEQREAKAADYYRYDYEIESYDVNIEVTRQNVYKISETLHVNFNESRHGIFRNIPLVNQVERYDGSKSVTRAVIGNVDCGGDEFELSREGDDCQIKIGDEDREIIGGKDYHIYYEYNLGKDVLPDIDEFYYNIIGTGWTDTTISNVTFSIKMPEAIDEEKMGMSYGPYGSHETKGLQYSIDGNTLQAKLKPDITLQPSEALTVRMELPEGYFEVTETIPIWIWLALVVGLAGMLTAIFLWWKFGRDDPVVETVEFHAPDGLNSVDLAFAYKGHLQNTDVVSLIVYLAQKGYIKIQQGTEKKPNKNTFTLIKVRDYDGNNEVERTFMQGLFSKKSQVTKRDLENSFYKTIRLIVGMVDNKTNRQVLFTKESINKGWILLLFTVAVYALAGWKPALDYYIDFFEGSLAFLIPSAVFSVVFFVMFRPMKTILLNILIGIVGLGIGLTTYVFFLDDALGYVNPAYRYVYLFAVAASAVILFFNTYLSKRTEYGTQILGRIRGFKRFLETAEKDRLEAMVAEDPQYFYEILPYTYVLDISDKWMKKFESITMEPPQWYSSYNYTMFDYMMFHSFMHSTMTAAASSMTSTPGSDGGGFSGGGSGGGGGGSW